jgi:hypothetical protein
MMGNIAVPFRNRGYRVEGWILRQIRVVECWGRDKLVRIHLLLINYGMEL